MAQMSAKDSEKAFELFVSGKKILIADTAASSRAAIAGLVIGMGIKTSQVALASSFIQAESEIDTIKPKVLICDFNLGPKSGLDLLQNLRAKYPDTKDSLFILATSDNSQSAVARAAEEDVDSYILKPFTAEIFRSAIFKATLFKMQPSEYIQVIERGKNYLKEGHFDDAIKSFDHAQKLDPTPALACYYSGQAHFMKKVIESAAGSYRTGLNFNKIHYRCMVGLYELLVSQKNSVEAYGIIKRISQYFPANPKRLAEVLRLAVVTESYDDIEKYYQLFTRIDDRNDEIVRYICAALVVCGKYYLRKGLQSRALELFQKAAISASGRTMILKEIILALADAGMIKNADEFMKRFPADTQNGKDYLTMKLLIADKSLPGALVVDMGRDLIKREIQDPLIYQILINRSVDAGLDSAVQDLVEKAGALWPDRKEAFSKMPATRLADLHKK